MNSVDLALGFLLVVCGVRGYWRGFIRECFGLIALIGGVAAALRFTPLGEALLHEHLKLPLPVVAGVAFVVIFVAVHSVVNLVGALLSRLVGAWVLRGINGLAGAVLAAGKGAAVLAFVLLFLHLLPIVPGLDPHVMTSTIGRPLVVAAGDVIRFGVHAPTQSAAPRKA